MKMKKLFLSLALVLLLATQSFGTAYYFDFISGDDDTGTGTYSNPWKTIAKCTTSKTATDECRGAKTTPTSLSGTLTFTNGASTISTSVDLTGELSVGDWVGKNTAGEGWWRVEGITSDTITLLDQYWGASEATTAYKAVYYTIASGDTSIGTSGTSGTRFKVSGGWDLSTQTQDGVTFYSNYGVSYYIVLGNSRDYIELSNFVFLCNGNSSYARIISERDYWYVHDLNINYGGLSLSGYNSLYEDIVISTSPWDAFAINGEHILVDGLRVNTGGDSYLDDCLVFNSSNFNFVKNAYLYNCYSNNLSINGLGVAYAENITIDTNRDGSSAGVNVDNCLTFLKDVSISNSTGNGMEMDYDSSVGSTFTDVTFSSIAGNDYYFYGSGAESPYNPMFFKNYNGVAGDDRIVFSCASGGCAASERQRILRNTTDARSGTCLQFQPYALSGAPNISYPVGSVVVSSTVSDIELSAYIKDDASWNGVVWFTATQDGIPLVYLELKTPTTSYVKNSVTVSASDLEVGGKLELWVVTYGSAGSLFVDDFEAVQ